ncbi:MAG: hypothetical protein U0271_10425 [Polyangiaceae bacterium]
MKTTPPSRRTLLVSMLSVAAISFSFGCGDDTGTGASGGSGGGGAPAAGGGGQASVGGDGGSGGAGGAVDPLETAVRGHDWVKLPNGPTVSQGKQDDIFFLNKDKGFLASGPKGAIFSTEDGGASWTQVFTSATTYFRAVLFTDELHGFAGNIGAGLAPSISDINLMYETTDGGATWNPVTNITGSAAKGLCNFTAVDQDTIFGIGRANGPAHLLQSSDGGANWVATDLSTWLMMAIDGRFTSATDGLVVGMAPGAKCSVIRTTDGGATFNSVFTSATPGSLCWKIQFPSPDVGYVAILDTANGSGTFAKTLDGGLTWQEFPLPTNGSPYTGIGVGFINENIGWMAPEEPNEEVYRTFDGGMTWEVDPVLKAPINRFRFVDANTAYAVGGAVWKLDLSGN